MRQMKTQSLLLLNFWRFVNKVIKNSLILSVILILYSPIAMNWLYNALKQEKIMSALDSVSSQDSARENLASKPIIEPSKVFCQFFFKLIKFLDVKL